ncbi:hypothetical protein DY000_02021236 [Brassica cretica]|uniref:Retrotransposon gag domain-containing protein n=1 Tax=Brassica cretica TaxID=69181 RepID=A0ABQ7E4B0_BRACR|nr:hypothetical protein DY000_02021236 [Brassica cretica]
MAVDENDELPEATQREAKLQRQIDDLQGQSAEKLSQLESENLTLRDENQALNAASNKKRRFRTQVRPMPPLETPNSGTGASLPTAAHGGEASTREKANDAQTYDWEDSDSEPEPDKEASDRAARAESPMIAHLYQMFSYRLDAMQSMVPEPANRNRGMYQNRPIEKAEGMAVSTWPNISHLSVSRPELFNVQRQMGQQVKWPQKMKAPDLSGALASGPSDPCHLGRFGNQRHKPCRGEKSTWNAKHGLEAAKPKRLLLGTDEISFTAKGAGENNGSSGNIIFQATYKDLRLDEGGLTRRTTPLIGFSGESNPDSYADTPFTDEITLIEMPRKFSFPSIKAYNGTTDPDDHVAKYRQRMLAVALPKGSREDTMCKGFGSTLTGPALQWYINLPSRSIASFAVLSDKFVEQFVMLRVFEALNRML